MTLSKSEATVKYNTECHIFICLQVTKTNLEIWGGGGKLGVNGVRKVMRNSSRLKCRTPILGAELGAEKVEQECVNSMTHLHMTNSYLHVHTAWQKGDAK